MQVFRVQNSQGVGPFSERKGEFASDWDDRVYEKAMFDPYKHPSPQVDGLVKGYGDVKDHHRFGCPDLDSLLTWFPGDWIEFFESYGFEVHCMEVITTKISQSGIQCMFSVDDIESSFTI